MPSRFVQTFATKLRTSLGSSSNRSLLLNAGSMIGTTVITAGLGFAYWWLAARLFPPSAVGFASALISAMTLLGTLGMMGLGTLLIGELPQQPGQRGALIATALLVTGGIATLLGLLFAVIAPLVSAEFHLLTVGVVIMLLFILGVELTSITLVLDQALIGLLRGELQLWRNAIFAVVKLLALLGVGLWLADSSGLSIYATWAFGNLLSLAALSGFVLLRGIPLRAGRPRWSLLRRLPGAALMHHALNLALQLPALGLPIIVTVLLSATLNASFYMAWLLLHLVFAIPYTLTIVLYASGVADRAGFAQKIRLTLGLATTLGVLSNLVLWVGADFLMGIFGPSYATEAAWPLRIMGLGVFPLIIKDHYVATCRVNGRIGRTAMYATLGSVLELSLAAVGAGVNGLIGLSVGLVLAMCVEAVLMVRAVYTSAVVTPPAPAPACDLPLAPMEHI
jgi:O-antigen/teichoic acid export membrane protein